MRKDSLIKLIALIVVIVGGFAAFVSPLAYSIRQGLDLQGGTHVVLEGVDTPQAAVNEDAMQRVVKIIEKRVNELGLTEPLIQREGERRIIVELPGIKDPDKAIQILGKTAMLEFKDEAGNTVLTGTDLKDAHEQTDQSNQNFEEMGRTLSLFDAANGDRMLTLFNKLRELEHQIEKRQHEKRD